MVTQPARPRKVCQRHIRQRSEWCACRLLAHPAVAQTDMHLPLKNGEAHRTALAPPVRTGARPSDTERRLKRGQRRNRILTREDEPPDTGGHVGLFALARLAGHCDVRRTRRRQRARQAFGLPGIDLVGRRDHRNFGTGEIGPATMSGENAERRRSATGMPPGPPLILESRACSN